VVWHEILFIHVGRRSYVIKHAWDAENELLEIYDDYLYFYCGQLLDGFRGRSFVCWTGIQPSAPGMEVEYGCHESIPNPLHAIILEVKQLINISRCPGLFIDEMNPDPTWAYFWPAINKRPICLWPGYFLSRPAEIFLIRREKIKKFGDY